MSQTPIRRLDARTPEFMSTLDALLAFASEADERIDAAASTSAFFSPPGVGTTMISSPTPATLAGIAFISTELG